MERVLSLAQMESLYPGEWLLVANPKTDASLVVRSGRVAWHGTDREEVYRKAKKLRAKRCAVLFTGSMDGYFAL
jgi:hypothetical protein